MIVLKSANELEKMRVAGRMVAEVLAIMKERIAPGITTIELDRLAEAECKKRKAKPAFKGYGGFPYAICASPNEKVVHGFPDNQPLQEGEILSIDFGILYDGYHGDSAFTMPVGKIDEKTEFLLKITEESLLKGIEASVVGGRLSDISNAVQTHVEKEGFSVVREFVGHGIGSKLHEAPQIPNYGPKGQGPRLKAGMTLAIEPMINVGRPGVKVLEDGWTAVTIDGELSCHFEHTMAVTENGPEILTAL
ncbi:MAG: type I methionyl aminopeptidase [Desulfuromonas sp.]|nr:MAG: type I methionyl aminopeptidase [Desulfuromonas sp.]